MRQVVLDTETTGLEPGAGHRIIELGCVEIINRRTTQKHFHYYLQPDREIDQGAFEVHGITREFLQDKPRFEEIADEFIDFIRDSQLIIHNAAFDTGFLDMELQRLGQAHGKVSDYCTVKDSLAFARNLHPGQKNDLSALCKRYAVDDSGRSLHGALLDAEILADVYLAMTGGQANLALGGDQSSPEAAGMQAVSLALFAGRTPVVPAGPKELEAHRERLDAIERQNPGNCLWHQNPDLS